MPLIIYCHEMVSPLGMLLLAHSAHGLAGIEFGLEYPAAARLRLQTRLGKRWGGNVRFKDDASPLQPTLEWLDRYFQNPAAGVTFSGPLDLGGTQFQRAAWSQLLKIPAGATMSYGEVAAAIERPGAMRAVGTACGANPVPIIIPCHRVTASDGIGGFGPGVAVKIKMLASEGVEIG